MRRCSAIWPASSLRSAPVGEAPLLADPAAAHDPFPLTPVQEAYWLGRQSLVELGEVACHVYVEFRLRTLDLERLTWAWRTVIDRHPMLRTVIEPAGTQRILAEVPPSPSPLLISVRLPPTMQNAALALRETMSHQVLPCDRWPLFEVRVTRISADDWRLHLSIDALILDGESSNLLLQEVFDLYHGRTSPAAPLNSPSAITSCICRLLRCDRESARLLGSAARHAASRARPAAGGRSCAPGRSAL